MSNIVKEDQTQSIIKESDLKDFLKFHNINLNDNEAGQFLKVCQMHGLNPFKRDIHVSKFGQNFNVVVGYEVYIRRAEASQRLDGWKTIIEPCKSFAIDDYGQLSERKDLKATVIINRKDFDKPFEHSVKLSEYLKKTRDGKVTKFWREMPETMIKKVAISQGFRLCFNEVLGGMPYTKEEMQDVDYVDITPKYEEAPVIDIDSLINELKVSLIDCRTEEDTRACFKSFPELKKSPEAIELCKKHISELNQLESQEYERKVNEENETSTEN